MLANSGIAGSPFEAVGRTTKLVLVTCINGLGQSVLTATSTEDVQSASVLALLSLMETAIMIPLSLLAPMDASELRRLVIVFDIVDFAFLVTIGVLFSKQIARSNELGKVLAISVADARAVCAATAFSWLAVALNAALVVYSLHEVGRSSRISSGTSTHCQIDSEKMGAEHSAEPSSRWISGLSPAPSPALRPEPSPEPSPGLSLEPSPERAPTQSPMAHGPGWVREIQDAAETRP